MAAINTITHELPTAPETKQFYVSFSCSSYLAEQKFIGIQQGALQVFLFSLRRTRKLKLSCLCVCVGHTVIVGYLNAVKLNCLQVGPHKPGSLWVRTNCTPPRVKSAGPLMWLQRDRQACIANIVPCTLKLCNSTNILS